MSHKTVKHSETLQAYLQNLGQEPGVYRMLDANGSVLYVGKAKNLKKRVSSYFSNKNHSSRIRSLVQQIASIESTVTRSESEALLLECNLIKTLQPKYNVLLRDDKSYPYIHVTGSTSFPRMELYRSKKKPNKNNYFGPYTGISAVKSTLSTIQKIFKIRQCKESYFNSRTRPCLQYEIGRCSAPCTGYITQAAYQQSLQDAIDFLQGKSQAIIAALEQRMSVAVSNLAFEEAAVLRDQIKNLRLVQTRQTMVQLRGDADVVAIHVQPGFACIQWVSIREGQVLGSQVFTPSVPYLLVGNELGEEDETAIEVSPAISPKPADELYQQVLEAFIAFFYLDNPERIPGLLILDNQAEKIEILANLLTKIRGKRCRVTSNPRGKNAQWLDFASHNLHLSVREHFTLKESIQERYEELEKLLNCALPIVRMECFDVSHSQGEACVASCVVFDASGPARKHYRRFNIRDITPGDDYAAMEQALRRRFRRVRAESATGLATRPDILIIDGGKGQVSVAKKILLDLDLDGIQVIGIAKGPQRKAGLERLFLVTQNCEISLPPDSKALHLLQQIRDEAHRFAITHHRQKRHKARFDSSLEDIEGIGAKRRQALLHRFGSVRELAQAPVYEISKVTGINRALAERIFNHFHG